MTRILGPYSLEGERSWFHNEFRSAVDGQPQLVLRGLGPVPERVLIELSQNTGRKPPRAEELPVRKGVPRRLAPKCPDQPDTLPGEIVQTWYCDGSGLKFSLSCNHDPRNPHKGRENQTACRDAMPAEATLYQDFLSGYQPQDSSG